MTEADLVSENLCFLHEVMDGVQHMHQLNNMSSPTYFNIPSMSGYLVIVMKVQIFGGHKMSANVIILKTKIVYI
jgi:hypothetical protein